MGDAAILDFGDRHAALIGMRPGSPFWPDEEFGNNTNDDKDDDFTPGQIGSDGEECHFLDLDNDVRGTLGSQDAPVFYQVDRDSDRIRITYHVFYAYNDRPSVQNHEGDWERITIEVDPTTLAPMTARYSAHEHNTVADYQDLPLDPETGRPLVYAAGGSHANYTTPGEHSTEVPVFKDHTVTDRNNDGKIDEADGAVFFDTARNLGDVRQQDWYPQDGEGVHWGEIGEFDFTTGPRGPSSEKGHLN